MKQNNIAVYTAIFGDYDDLKNENTKLKGCDLFCFTDNKNLKSDKFKIVVRKPEYNDNTRNAKIYKILPHLFFSNYEYSLWVDGSVIIKEFNIQKIIENYLDGFDMALFKHPDRDCIYDEVNACIDLKKDDPEIMINQVEKYKKEGYPPHFGLAACTIILRRHNEPEIIRMNEEWWSEIKKYSKRDQLSFNYVVWKNNLKYNIIDGLLWDNDYFKVIEHKK